MWRVITLLLFASTVVAQTDPAAADQAAPPNMKFDVVSIRPVKTEPGHLTRWQEGGFLPSNSSHLAMTHWNLYSALTEAFSLQPYQVVGYDKLPADVIYNFYSIQARGSEGVDKRLAELPKDQCRAEQQRMLQALLVDRFQLKFHWEDRAVPGYRLVIGKHGSKLLPVGSLPIDAATRRMRGDDGKMLAMHQSRDELGNPLYVGRGASIADLVRIASARLNSPIQDATGLDGKYDFDLRIGGRTTEDDPQEDQKNQTIDAVQDQLGLRLEPAQTTQKVLVIDHVEAPSPN